MEKERERAWGMKERKERQKERNKDVVRHSHFLCWPLAN